MRVVIDHNDSPAIGHESDDSPLGRASVDRPLHMPKFEYPLDLNTREVSLVGPGRRVDRPDETLKDNVLPRTRLLP